jgi:hypothetical protein
MIKNNLCKFFLMIKNIKKCNFLYHTNNQKKIKTQFCLTLNKLMIKQFYLLMIFEKH